MNVLVTGATGFTGARVVPLLLDRARVRCFVRPSSNVQVLPVDRVELAYGDVSDQASLERALRGVDVLVNVASLGFGHTPAIVGAALNAGVKRAIFVSTTAVFTTLNAASKAVRLEAEATIAGSGLAYTILRPTMVYGSPRDRNMCRLIRYLRRWPAIPIFGSGEFKQQPVFVEDVAEAIARCVEADHTAGRSYNLPGASPLTYNTLIDTVCELLQRNVRKIHLRVAPIVAVLSSAERMGLRLPVKAEQILRLNEDKVFSCADASRDFGYRPRAFADGIRREIELGA
jgi:nucleoside-diphosphate-sugar epimerase